MLLRTQLVGRLKMSADSHLLKCASEINSPPPLFFFSFLLPVCQGTVSFDLFTRQGGVGGEEDPRQTTGAACEQIKVIKAKMSPGTHLVSALSRDPLTSERRRHGKKEKVSRVQLMGGGG